MYWGVNKESSLFSCCMFIKWNNAIRTHWGICVRYSAHTVRNLVLTELCLTRFHSSALQNTFRFQFSIRPSSKVDALSYSHLRVLHSLAAPVDRQRRLPDCRARVMCTLAQCPLVVLVHSILLSHCCERGVSELHFPHGYCKANLAQNTYQQTFIYACVPS